MAQRFMTADEYDAALIVRQASRRQSASWLAFELCTAASLDRSENAAATTALLAAGANPNAVSQGRPALMWAMIGANAPAVRALCAAGADMHVTSGRVGEGANGLVMSIIMALCRTPPPWPERAYVESLRALADAGRDITRCVANGQPAGSLYGAAMCGAERVLAFLLEAGADVNQSDCFSGTPLHAAVDVPLVMKGRDMRVATEQSLRCVRRLLRAGADTRVRRFNKLAVDNVLMVGDLRVADAIFDAEDRRGISDASLWEEEERSLRAAVAVYRRTGDASLPQALRLRGAVLIDRPSLGNLSDWEPVDESQLTPAMHAAMRELPTHTMPSVEFAAMQAGVAAQVPRSVDEAHSCAAPGCGALGAALKVCPCRRAYYCSKECQVSHWKVHRKSPEHKQGKAAPAPTRTDKRAAMP